MSDTLLRIGELASRAGVSNRTVDYYTNLGLLTPAERTGGNYRLYTPTDVDRIALIRRLEEQGLPLEEIGTALRGRQHDLATILGRIDDDIQALQAAAEAASPAAQGLMAAVLTRIHSLINLALHIPPDLPLL